MILHTLDADTSSELTWDFTEKRGMWHLDFGWDRSPFNPFNPIHFHSAMLAVEEFSKQVDTPTEIVLLRNSGTFSNLLQTSEIFQNRFQESNMEHELFCAELISEYLHRLASALPDEIEPKLMFDIEEPCDFAQLVLRLCRRRFEHFQLIFPSIAIPIDGDAPIGVALPQDNEFDAKIFNSLFTQLDEESYICIPEEFLNEHWDGLDYLIVDSNVTSEIGIRMLYGFEAAGGSIVTMGKKLGFENEMTLENFFTKSKRVSSNSFHRL